MYVVGDPAVAQQGVAEARARDALAVVGRDAELGLEAREVEEEEVARVAAGDLRVDLGLVDGREGVFVEEAAQEGEAPVQGYGPALVARVGVGIALEDLEGDVGLGIEWLG